MSFLKTTAIQHLNGSSPAITFDASGNVGIGVTSTNSKLHVAEGSIRIDGPGSGAALGEINFGYSGLATAGVKIAGLRVASNMDQHMVFYTSNTTTSGVATERMRIDNSGRVTTPYQPGCYVGKSDGSWTGTCIFNVTSGSKGFHNTGGHYNASNGRFTAPKSGRYFIAVDSMTQNNNSASHLYYYLSLNGTVAATAYGWSGTVNTHFPLSMCRMLYLNENEYVEVVGGTGAFYGSDSSYTTLAIYLVG
jgi:hypothetical protein